MRGFYDVTMRIKMRELIVGAGVIKWCTLSICEHALTLVNLNIP